MLNAGALEEVAALAARRLDPLLPAMKAHGVPGADPASQGRDHTGSGGCDRPRRYPALRQAAFTWFRHQLPEFEWVKPEAAREWLSSTTSS